MAPTTRQASATGDRTGAPFTFSSSGTHLRCHVVRFDRGTDAAPDGAREASEPFRGHFLDFKSTRIDPAKLTRHLAAFCNADGGDLYIGVEEVGGELECEGFG